MLEISLSYGGSFAIINCAKELTNEEILNDFSKKLDVSDIDWLPTKEDKAFGVLSLNNPTEEESLQFKIKNLANTDRNYEIIQVA